MQPNARSMNWLAFVIPLANITHEYSCGVPFYLTGKCGSYLDLIDRE
jgi:hypothetical protein